MRLRPSFSAVSLVCLSLVLAACGGGSHMAPAAPTFTSTPVTAAQQGVAYSYSVTATDPSGGTVSFALTTAPTGAALSGNAVNWTPAASQSRLANSFTVTATTSEGGTATQSWAVSPSGTVTVSTVNTEWTPNGQVLEYISPIEVAAYLVNSDGSLTVYPGTMVSPALFQIPGVPAGYYWLALGPLTSSFYNSYWTSASSFDGGFDVAGAGTPFTSNAQTTEFNFTLSGLAPGQPGGTVVFSTDSLGLQPVDFPVPNGATTLNVLFSSDLIDRTVDWSQISSAFLMQYSPESVGPLNLLTLGPELTLSDLSFVDGGTNAITATLAAGPPVALNLTVPGTQWAPLFSNAGPGTIAASSSWLAVSPEPYVTGVNVTPNLLGPGLPYAFPVPSPIGAGSSLPSGNCVASQPFLPFGQGAILTDQTLGTLSYNDPFPSTWTRALSFCQAGTVTIPFGTSLSSSFPMNVVDGESIPPASTSLAPLVAQVQNPMLNGASLFTAASMTSGPITLNWNAPATGAPFGYVVSPIVVVQNTNGFELLGLGSYHTAKTSITLPPLAANTTAIFLITALVDGTANMETSPLRSSLPTAFSTVVSAAFNILPGASSNAAHGDADFLKRLSKPVLLARVPAVQAK
jgi:hypothetical protein